MAKAKTTTMTSREPLVFGRATVVALFKKSGVSKTAHKETDAWLSTKLGTLADHLDDDDLSELESRDEDLHEVAVAALEEVAAGGTVVVTEADADADADDDTEEAEVEADDDTEEDEEAEVEADDDTEEDEEEEEPVVTKKPAKKSVPVPAKAAAKTPPVKAGKKPAPVEADDDDDEAPVKAKAGKKPVHVPAKAGKKPVPVPPKSPAKKPVKEKEAVPKKPRKSGVIYQIVNYLSKASAAKPVTKAAIIIALVKKFGGERTEQGMTVTVNSQINGQLKANWGIQLGKKEMKSGERGFWIEDLGKYILED